MADFKINRDDDIVRTEEGLVFNPYNPLNIKITLSEVQFILSKYGLPTTVDNMALFERAFVHRSYTKRPGFENIQHRRKLLPGVGGGPDDCRALGSRVHVIARERICRQRARRLIEVGVLCGTG